MLTGDGDLPFRNNKNTLKTYPVVHWGCSPWAASPYEGERGSFSKMPQRINECRQKSISTEPAFYIHQGWSEKNVFCFEYRRDRSYIQQYGIYFMDIL